MKRKRNYLLTDMADLVTYATDLIKAGNDHHTTCVTTANWFNIWEQDGEGNSYFPIWLSRVIEGIMRDVEDQ